MAGERSVRIVDVAARAAQRMAKRLALIDDLYAPETAASYVRSIERERWIEHFIDVGHWAPEPGCTDDVCLTVAAMIQSAYGQLAQMQQQQPQQGAA